MALGRPRCHSDRVTQGAGLPRDEVLVARLRAGDEEAFAAMLDAWSGGMLRLARSWVSSTASAQDVVQETWLAVVGGIAGFEGRSSLRTWVFRILVNAARARSRAEGREVAWSFAPTEEDLGPTVDPSRFRSQDPWKGHWEAFPARWPAPEQLATDNEVMAELERAVEALPPRQRVVIALRDVDGHTAAEVCEILAISEGNQRVLLHRARASVRGRLEAFFETTGARPGGTP